MGYQRRHVAAGVDMLEHRPRYTVSAEGWARHDKIAEVYEDCTSATAAATAAVVGHGSGDALQTTQVIESELNAAICRPYVVNTINGAYWTVTPAADVDLETEVGERWGLTWTRQRNMRNAADTDYVASEWVTQYTLAPNPFILIGIRRPGRPEDCTVEPFTDITFGLENGTGWSLHIPYGDNAQWYELVDSEWIARKWTHGSHHIPEGAQGEEQELVFIFSVVRGALCVSMMGNGQGDSFAWCQPNGEEEANWPFIASSELRIRHYPGELSVLAQPLYMTDTWLTGPAFWVGQDYGDADETYLDAHSSEFAYRLSARAWGYNVTSTGYTNCGRTDYAGATPALTAGECRISVADHEEAAATNYCRWRVHLKPYEHTGYTNDETEVKSYSSPACCAVTLQRMAVLVDGGPLAIVADVTERVNRIELDFADEFGATEARMRVLNRAHNNYWARGIGTFRPFHIRNHRWREYDAEAAAWRDADEVTSLEYVWSLEPELEGEHAEVPCVDLMGVINHARVHGQVPIGDGWNLHDYIRHSLQLAQVGEAWCDLEDIGVTIPNGTPENPACMPQRGQRFGEWLAHLQDKYGDHGAVWAEDGQIRTGCRYCGAPRTAANYESHHDNGWQSTGCLAEDVIRAGASGIDLALFTNPEEVDDPDALGRMTQVRVYTATLDDEVFANWVNVEGEDLDERPLTATVYNSASLATPGSPNYTGGWKIMRVETDSALRTQVAVARRAYTLNNDLSERPLWFTGTVIADASLKRGFVVSVAGGDALGIDGVKGRIMRMGIPIIRDGVPYVRLYCRTIGTVS